jgi:hypothetical protein
LQHGGEVQTSVDTPAELNHFAQSMLQKNVNYMHKIHNNAFKSQKDYNLVLAVVHFRQYLTVVSQITNDTEKCPLDAWFLHITEMLSQQLGPIG